jgi:hypothetical protein
LHDHLLDFEFSCHDEQFLKILLRAVDLSQVHVVEQHGEQLGADACDDDHWVHAGRPLKVVPEKVRAGGEDELVAEEVRVVVQGDGHVGVRAALKRIENEFVTIGSKLSSK